MSRPTTSKNTSLVMVVAIVAVVVATGMLIVHNVTATPSTEIGLGTYFTTDDGATYFAGSPDQIAPIDVGGKQAYRAHLGTETNGKIRVFFIERMTPQGKAALLKAKTGASLSPAESEALRNGFEYKAVGDSKWHTFNNDMAKMMWMKSLVGADGKPPGGLM